MDQRKLLDLQTRRGAKSVGSDISTKSLDWVINDCRKNIQSSSDRYRKSNPSEKKSIIRDIIVDYVMDTKPLVDGFVDEENRSETIRLVDKLIEAITDYDFLTSAIVDPDVYEIRGNGKELKVEIKGRIKDLVDKEGNILSFESVEQQEVILRKLLGTIRLTPKDALVNGRTLEGFRIAVVHSSAISPDPNDPTADQYHAFVLRKFRKSKMGLGDIVKFGSMSDNMARALQLTTASGLTTLACGPTASGKTSLLNAILQGVPPSIRVVLLQNPSEIDIRMKDASGRVYNDAIHLEASERDNPTPSDPTMSNLMDITLRFSPVYVVLGEIRSNLEFEMGMKILGAGHPLFASLHAEDAMGAMRRFLRGYMASSGETIETALPGLADVIKVIVVQKIMRDGTRKVLQISEVLGMDPKMPNTPLLNDLFIFEPVGDPTYDSAGNVMDIPGIHKRVGKLSDSIVRKLKLDGIKASRFDFLMNDVDENEKEEYTGENIVGYGMQLVK